VDIVRLYKKAISFFLSISLVIGSILGLGDTQVFASGTNILYNKWGVYGTDLGVSNMATKSGNDDNTVSAADLGKDGSTYDTGWIDLGVDYTILTYRMWAPANVTLKLYDVNKTLLKSVVAAANDYTERPFGGATSNVRYVAFVNTSATDMLLYEIAVYTDETPPAEVTSLSETHTGTTVKFSFTNPPDVDFKQADIFRNGILVGSSANGSYTDSGLLSGITYSYRVATVDTYGNRSTGKNLAVTTLDTVPPAVPSGLSVKSGDSQVTLSWKPNSEKDFMGYYLYEDGLKLNIPFLTKTDYLLTGLKNGQTYNFAIAAIDSNNNLSVKSASVAATPQINNPIDLIIGLNTINPKCFIVNYAVGTTISSQKLLPLGYASL
jgi:hypothetical protein